MGATGLGALFAHELMVNGAQDLVSNVAFSISQFFNSFLFNIWLSIAVVIDTLEAVFMMLAGVSEIYRAPIGIPIGEDASYEDITQEHFTGDLITFLIQSDAVQTIFASMIAVATVLLIFFTVIQLIRNQYKEKDGGNPYVTVFRMIKGMVLFLFITAAVVVGISLSGVVLGVLNQATTHGVPTTLSGTLFRAKAFSGNRARSTQGEIDGFDAANLELNNRIMDQTRIMEDGSVGKQMFHVVDANHLFEFGAAPGLGNNLVQLPRSEVRTTAGGADNEGIVEDFQLYDMWDITFERTYDIQYHQSWFYQYEVWYDEETGLRWWIENHHLGGPYRNEFAKGEYQYSIDPVALDDSLGLPPFFVRPPTNIPSPPRTVFDVLNAPFSPQPHPFANELQMREALQGSWRANVGNVDDPTYSPGTHNSVLTQWTAFNNRLTSSSQTTRNATARDVLNALGRPWQTGESSSLGGHQYFTPLGVQVNLNQPLRPGIDPWGDGADVVIERRVTSTQTRSQVYTARLPLLRGSLGEITGSAGSSGDHRLRNLFNRVIEQGLTGGGLGQMRDQILLANGIPLIVVALEGVENATNEHVAYWIDTQMINNGTDEEMPQYLIFLARTGAGNNRVDRFMGALSFTNAAAVVNLYSVSNMSGMLGWLGAFIIIGVLLNFTFGLVQRLVEMLILYMLSPLTLAFYPFDDGSSFNSNFVKPFYKKTIAIFAPLLAMNLFFVIYPAISQIQFFPSYPEFFFHNLIANTIVMLALFTMLPAIRGQIQTMLGADSLQEKKMSSVWKDSATAVLGGAAGGWVVKNASMAGAKRAATTTGKYGKRAAAYTKADEANKMALSERINEKGELYKEQQKYDGLWRKKMTGKLSDDEQKTLDTMQEKYKLDGEIIGGAAFNDVLKKQDEEIKRAENAVMGAGGIVGASIFGAGSHWNTKGLGAVKREYFSAAGVEKEMKDIEKLQTEQRAADDDATGEARKILTRTEETLYGYEDGMNTEKKRLEELEKQRDKGGNDELVKSLRGMLQNNHGINTKNMTNEQVLDLAKEWADDDDKIKAKLDGFKATIDAEINISEATIAAAEKEIQKRDKTQIQGYGWEYNDESKQKLDDLKKLIRGKDFAGIDQFIEEKVGKGAFWADKSGKMAERLQGAPVDEYGYEFFKNMRSAIESNPRINEALNNSEAFHTLRKKHKGNVKKIYEELFKGFEDAYKTGSKTLKLGSVGTVKTDDRLGKLVAGGGEDLRAAVNLTRKVSEQLGDSSKSKFMQGNSLEASKNAAAKMWDMTYAEETAKYMTNAINISGRAEESSLNRMDTLAAKITALGESKDKAVLEAVSQLNEKYAHLNMNLGQVTKDWSLGDDANQKAFLADMASIFNDVADNSAHIKDANHAQMLRGFASYSTDMESEGVIANRESDNQRRYGVIREETLEPFAVLLERAKSHGGGGK
ncbi:MAG: hypothetical protein FWE45_04315 [Firmicutes bacterium]|nr:hypothetical protein [Bacillota bacterium]